MNKQKILLIIPAYNEEANIVKVCEKIKEYNQKNNEVDYIVINDGSKDRTEELLVQNNINHIRLLNNLGIGGAVQTGYKYAEQNDYDIAVQFDGDGQHDISYVKALCEPIIENKVDMCIGSRFLNKETSKFKSVFMRRMGKNIISFMIKLLAHKKITDPTSGFRAVNKKLITEFANDYPLQYPEPVSTKNIVSKKYIVEEIPVSMNERQGGKSSIGLFKSVDYMIKVCISLLIGRRK